MSSIIRQTGFVYVLRRAAVIVVVAGAAASVALMLHAGRRQQSRILLLAFVIWVLSPFVGALVATSVAKRWAARTRTTLYVAMVAITIGPLLIYEATAFGSIAAKVGFVFLVVPAASWLIMAIAVATAAFISRRRDESHPSAGV